MNYGCELYVLSQGPYRVILNSVTNVTDDFKSRGLIYTKLFGTHPRGREPQYLWGESHYFSEIDNNMSVSAFPSYWQKSTNPSNSLLHLGGVRYGFCRARCACEI